VVDVAGQQQDARRRLAVPAGGDLAEAADQASEGVLERGPVLEVQRLADALAERGESATPR
jgi:hypothetical protein